MDTSAARIHDSLEKVAGLLRAESSAQPVLAEAARELKSFQAHRFQATYADDKACTVDGFLRTGDIGI